MRGVARLGKTYVFLYEDRFLRKGGRQHAELVVEAVRSLGEDLRLPLQGSPSS
jgi:hypothetical protein